MIANNEANGRIGLPGYCVAGSNPLQNAVL
jgi:hypothetical protein